MTQSLRRSQFIVTYGPGSILEGPDGPRVIPNLYRSSLFNNRRPSDFEITDLRLSQALLNGAGILRLPSNAEVGEVDSAWIYDTDPFPKWALCIHHHLLYLKRQSDNRACPQCPALFNSQQAWRRVRNQAIRFVRACSQGHLDDVDWVNIIQHRGDNCLPLYLLWQGGGGALRHINIRCPNCGGSENLGVAYARTWPCSGRLPEQGTVRPRCSEPSKIIQRGAANLHITELRTALTIPPRATRLHRLLEMNNVRTVLIAQTFQSKQAIIDSLSRLVQNHLLPASVVNEINGYSERAILDAIDDVNTGGAPQSSNSLRLDEFSALRNAALYGAPPQPSPTPGAPPQFEVIREQIRSIPLQNGQTLRITPVNRLRVVMVQTGYKRLDPLNPTVDCAYNDGQRDWYPGVELFGEGIFLDLVPPVEGEHHGEQIRFNGEAASIWFDAWIDPTGFDQNIQREDRNQIHPLFVWWHTFSHRLINSLSIDSGYSSAAVRERVFIQIDENTGEAIGGLLLYTAQPGGDGTLGGMVALVPEFERVIDLAFRFIDSCSNDPLCGEEKFTHGKYNGAACYACSLVSETSCEHRNMRLDRNILLENPL